MDAERVHSGGAGKSGHSQGDGALMGTKAKAERVAWSSPGITSMDHRIAITSSEGDSERPSVSRRSRKTGN
jgi:hypothetical protein